MLSGFNHWGCKHTLGAPGLPRNALKKGHSAVDPGWRLAVTEVMAEKDRLLRDWSISGDAGGF